MGKPAGGTAGAGEIPDRRCTRRTFSNAIHSATQALSRMWPYIATVLEFAHSRRRLLPDRLRAGRSNRKRSGGAVAVYLLMTSFLFCDIPRALT